MDYNTETLNDIARQVAALMQTAVAKQAEGSQPAKIREVETMMREALRQIGAEALGQLLSSSAAPSAPTLACPCGGKLKYQRRRSAVVLSVFGRVSYERDYYAGCQCHSGQAPVDEQYGLQPGKVTAGLASLLGLAGIEFSFEQSGEWLKSCLIYDLLPVVHKIYLRSIILGRYIL
jgi:hypothetical protein